MKSKSPYITRHSTKNALIKVQIVILLDLDKNGDASIALLDQSSAFDTIDDDHIHLLSHRQVHVYLTKNNPGLPLTYEVELNKCQLTEFHLNQFQGFTVF